jgi:hypothetical protein
MTELGVRDPIKPLSVPDDVEGKYSTVKRPCSVYLTMVVTMKDAAAPRMRLDDCFLMSAVGMDLNEL